MEYKFQILTTQGIIKSTVSSDCDFTGAPFGYVPYRIKSTCECDENIINDFWRCVDEVLNDNNLTPSDYIRVIHAYSDDTLFGELE